MGASNEFRERCKASGGRGRSCTRRLHRGRMGRPHETDPIVQPYEAFVFQPLKDDETKMRTYRFPDPRCRSAGRASSSAWPSRRKNGTSAPASPRSSRRAGTCGLAELALRPRLQRTFVTALLDKLEEYEAYIVRRCAEAGVDYISMAATSPCRRRSSCRGDLAQALQAARRAHPHRREAWRQALLLPHGRQLVAGDGRPHRDRLRHH